MSIQEVKKLELIKQFALSEYDTGSVEVQCAVLTERIGNLTKHFQFNKKDFHSRRGLLVLVGRRRSLLEYLKKKSVTRYTSLIQRLGLRK